jgi:FkbM family methyltransferase
MLRDVYHALKRNRLASAVMQACDITLPIRLEGIPSPVYSRIISGHWVKDDYELDCRKAFRKIVRGIGAQTLFDIGANVGIYTAEFCAIVPNAHVVAMEPNKRIYGCLKRTCAKAGSRAVSIQAAVSDLAGYVNIKYDPLAPAMGGIIPGEDGLYNSERIYGAFLVSHHVRATMVDGTVRRYFTPDMVKIDVEGAELLVFKGGRELFSQHHPAIFFEFSRDKDEIASLIKSWGYVLFSERLKPISYPEFYTFALHRDRHTKFISESL